MKLELKQILAPKVFYGHTIDLVVTPYAPDFVFKVISVTINESVKITRRKKKKSWLSEVLYTNHVLDTWNKRKPDKQNNHY